MSPRFKLRRENVPCVAEVINRSLKADCTDFTNILLYLYNPQLLNYFIPQPICKNAVTIDHCKIAKIIDEKVVGNQ